MAKGRFDKLCTRSYREDGSRWKRRSEWGQNDTKKHYAWKDIGDMYMPMESGLNHAPNKREAERRNQDQNNVLMGFRGDAGTQQSYEMEQEGSASDNIYVFEEEKKRSKERCCERRLSAQRERRAKACNVLDAHGCIQFQALQSTLTELIIRPVSIMFMSKESVGCRQSATNLYIRRINA